MKFCTGEIVYFSSVSPFATEGERDEGKWFTIAEGTVKVFFATFQARKFVTVAFNLSPSRCHLA